MHHLALLVQLVVGWFLRSYENGFAADRRILVVNRDTKQNIHGEGAVEGAAYVVTMMVNGEHRPVYKLFWF